MSVVVTNPGAAEKKITVKTTTEYTIPAGGSIIVLLKPGDEIILE